MVAPQTAEPCYFSNSYRTGEDRKEKVNVKYKDD
jgi:hypothetical protein